MTPAERAENAVVVQALHAGEYTVEVPLLLGAPLRSVSAQLRIEAQLEQANEVGGNVRVRDQRLVDVVHGERWTDPGRGTSQPRAA